MLTEQILAVVVGSLSSLVLLGAFLLVVAYRFMREEGKLEIVAAQSKPREYARPYLHRSSIIDIHKALNYSIENPEHLVNNEKDSLTMNFNKLNDRVFS